MFKKLSFALALAAAGFAIQSVPASAGERPDAAALVDATAASARYAQSVGFYFGAPPPRYGYGPRYYGPPPGYYGRPYYRRSYYGPPPYARPWRRHFERPYWERREFYGRPAYYGY
jgi:hypothetical protein